MQPEDGNDEFHWTYSNWYGATVLNKGTVVQVNLPEGSSP
jgi:hypothetical protein